MATIISKNAFIDYDGKARVSFANIYVEYQSTNDGKREKVLMKDLYVKDKDSVRKVQSYSEFMKKLSQNQVVTGSSGVQTVKTFSDDVKLQIVGIKVPEQFTTISHNAEDVSIPYGLRRLLEVQEVADSTTSSDRYFYVKINGADEFVKPDEIYFYDKSNKKKFFKDVKNINTLKDVDLIAPSGEKIDLLYLEKQYVMPATLASETIDLQRAESVYTKKIKTQNEAGESVYETKVKREKIDKYFSEQSYLRTEIDDERRPGKKKEVSLIAVRNFQHAQDGEYYSVVVNGYTKMVHKDSIVDGTGKVIENVADMVGKSVNIKDGDKIASTEPLTYQQANLKYSTIKTFQPTKAKASEDTYLRLKNGEYVKENEAVKPISYKIVNLANAPFDAYLVKTVGFDGVEKFVVVAKDYFKKHGDSTELKQENAVKIQRCDFDSKECAVVQTTSKGNKIEQCSIVKKSKIKGTQINAGETEKRTAFEGFVTGYAEGQYVLKDILKDGETKELSERKERFELTDVAYLNDYADNLHEYNGLKVNDLRIEGGKLVGGPKYNVKKGIKSAFKKLGKLAGPLAWVWGGAGILIPVVGPMISAAIVATYVASVPFVPMFNALYGLAKNRQKTKFMEKSGYNQAVNKLDIEKRMKQLYERMTSKDYVPLPQARFEDEYQKLVNEIIALSNASVDNALIVENGVAKVTPENAYAAKEYMLEFEKTTKEQSKTTKECKKAEENFRRYESQVLRMQDQGRKVSPYYLEQYEKYKAIYEEKKKASDAVTAHYQSLLNYRSNPTELTPHTERDRLLKIASVMRTAVYFKSEEFKDHPLVQEAINGEKGLMDCTDLLTEEDLAQDDKKWTKEEIEEYRKQHADQSLRMLNNMKMDFKNGLIVDGRGVGLDDEEIAHTPEYSRGYEWAKVKQAIEVVHYGLNPQLEPPKTEDPVKPDETVDGKNPKEVENKKVAKTKLSDESLENLLKNIEILKKYDDIYAGADEDIPADIEIKIGKLEEKIKPDLHLLQRAAKNPNYDKYLTRVRRAAHIVQNHQSPHNRKLGSLNM